MKARIRPICCLVVSLGAIVAIASAIGSATAAKSHLRVARATRFSVTIQKVFTRAGDPLLVANFSPNGSLAVPRWRICQPQRLCGTRAKANQVLMPGPEPAGTRFIAFATYGGQTYSAQATWRGRIGSVSGPRLIGRRVPSGVLRPVAGQWRGGWGDEGDQLGVEACATPAGQHCHMLGGGELGCPDDSSSSRLGGWFTGAYVYALDARMAADGACAGTGYSTNADLPLWKLAATVTRSRSFGRIVGPPRPRVHILRSATRAQSVLLVASVRCRRRCRVSIDVDDGTSGRSNQLTVTGTQTVGVPAGTLQHGRLTVVVHVDDSPRIVGHTKY